MIPFPNKKYSVIYADPPWAYRTYSKKGQGRSAESHYPTMSLKTSRRFQLVIWQLRTALCFSGVRSRAYVKRSKC